MADYVNCPTCHGRGVIPLEEARRIEAHTATGYDAAREERRQQEAEGHRAEVAHRIKAAGERQRRTEEALSASRAAEAQRREQEAEAHRAELARRIEAARARMTAVRDLLYLGPDDEQS